VPQGFLDEHPGSHGGRAHRGLLAFGDGSGKAITITDPTTGKPFAGNQIPSGSIYAPGQAILNFLPAPNTTVGGFGYNYTSQVPASYPRMETVLRGDYQINSSTRMSVRWVYNHDDQQFPYGTTTASWNFPLTITDRLNGPGSVPSISLTKNFGPTWVNEAVFRNWTGRRHHRSGGHRGLALDSRHQHAAAVSQRRPGRSDPQPDLRRDREREFSRSPPASLDRSISAS